MGVYYPVDIDIKKFWNRLGYMTKDELYDLIELLDVPLPSDGCYDEHSALLQLIVDWLSVVRKPLTTISSQAGTFE